MNYLGRTHFFGGTLSSQDPEIFNSLEKELSRQRNEIELIASENIASSAVMEAQGSVMTNKYAEGYPGRRYYGGCENVDVAEQLAISRACQLYNCKFANVQPNSGSQANQAVFLALMKPGDTFLSMDLASGGHLTHGAKPNQSGKWFNPVHYEVTKDTNHVDYDQVRQLAKLHKPKLIIADEMTGNLDEKNANKLIDLLSEINKDFHQAIVLTTHNPQVARIGHKQFNLENGSLTEKA